MFRKNARLIPTTEKGGLATPLWSDSEFKSLLGVQMNIIVTEKVRQELTQKYEIHMHHPSHLRIKPQPLENN